ncbi:MAG: hypothetical protein NTX25_16035 [Proteobacteria bacterium]|nr:hypothetical protein [Pseudomonadota bacterium]
MTRPHDTENERSADPAVVKRVGITFLVATIFGAILVFLGVTSRSLQIRQERAAGIKSSNLPFGPIEPGPTAPVDGGAGAAQSGTPQP